MDIFSKPKKATSILFVRENASKKCFEVLMVLRSKHSHFVPNAFVFPGGAQSQEDYSPSLLALCSGVNNLTANEAIDIVENEKMLLSACITGIRESFEEVGILLAYASDGTLVSYANKDDREKYQHYRRALLSSNIKMEYIITREKLLLATDRMFYFSNWITPAIFPVRYNALFFIALMPPAQDAKHDGLELTDHIWLTPQEIIAKHTKKVFPMVYPTVMMLKELANYGSAEELFESFAFKHKEHGY
ncbi:MAG: hypothetical protein WCJ49_03555 [Deltaproteobacteria bacterium]